MIGTVKRVHQDSRAILTEYVRAITEATACAASATLMMIVGPHHKIPVLLILMPSAILLTSNAGLVTGHSINARAAMFASTANVST